MISQSLLEKFELDMNLEVHPETQVPTALISPLYGRAEILDGIPRFMPEGSNYTSNFGFQWKKFAKTQLDSYSGITLSRDRLFTDSGWTEGELKGKKVLEVGSGAGRFTEILLETGALVYSFDYSGAVEANFANHGRHPNLFLFQGSVYDLPFPDHFFDYVFCFGVLQHTPDPLMALQKIVQHMKPEGKIAVDNYPTGSSAKRKRPNVNYRKVAKRLSFLTPPQLFRFVWFYHQFWFPIDMLIRTKLPPTIYPKVLYYIGIPCFNYVHLIKLPYKQLKEWAILDTFDALGAKYDYPVTREAFQEMGRKVNLKNATVDIAFNGFVLKGQGKG